MRLGYEPCTIIPTSSILITNPQAFNPQPWCRFQREWTGQLQRALLPESWLESTNPQAFNPQPQVLEGVDVDSGQQAIVDAEEAFFRELSDW